MGRRTRGVEVPKIQTQSPFTGQFGHFCGPIGRKNILHTSPSTSPSPSLRYKKNRDKSKYLSNIVKKWWTAILLHITKLWWTVILLHITKLCQPAILSHNHQYCFTLPNHANHSRFEWVNFFSGDLWWCCIYSTILETLLRRHPHHHTSNPSPCSSGCFWLYLLCTTPNIYYKWDSRLKIIYFIQNVYLVWNMKAVFSITELKKYVQPSAPVQKYLAAQSLGHKYMANKFLHSQCSA